MAILTHDSPVWVFSFNEKTGETNITVPKADKYGYKQLVLVSRMLCRFIAWLEAMLAEMEAKQFEIERLQQEQDAVKEKDKKETPTSH
jgi:hypothetical protein